MRQPVIKEEPKSPTTPTNHTKIGRVSKRKVAVKTELCDQMAAQYGGVPGEKMKIEDSDNVLESIDTRFDGKKTSIFPLIGCLYHFPKGLHKLCNNLDILTSLYKIIT